MSWTFPPTSPGTVLTGQILVMLNARLDSSREPLKGISRDRVLLFREFSLDYNETNSVSKETPAQQGVELKEQHPNPVPEPLWPTMASSDRRITPRDIPAILCLHYCFGGLDAMRLV